MKYRQVHLDFHTSEKIEGIGTAFSKEQFQQALKTGHVDSITVFSKCHHGWSYHPVKTGRMHPHLQFDLLGVQIQAAHEIGVQTPVYLSAGLDEKLARKHPDWLIRNKDESTIWAKNFQTPGYHRFCFNSPYLEYLLEQIKEVCENYDADGIFLDITGVYPCYCQNCIKSMQEAGLDPENDDDIWEQAEKVYANYCRRVRETVDSIKPGLPVFHNCGSIIRGRRDLAHRNSHLEIESLPTGRWGYDDLPLTASYAQTIDMEYLGMTGKFHEAWGEFGGYKHPNALRYEAALSAAFGGKCSIGDQLHPTGSMDENTYFMIGKAYGELEQKEEWLKNSWPIADVALLSAESVCKRTPTEEAAVLRGNMPDATKEDIEAAEAANKLVSADIGAVRILLEEKYLFQVIDPEADFSGYKVLILPDVIDFNDASREKLKKKIKAYVVNGGKVLATGRSGIEKEFVLDLGAEYLGVEEYCPNYFRPGFEMEDYLNAAFVMRSEGTQIKETGQVLGWCEEPYFNRSTFAFCSHQHTPTSGKPSHPGMTLGKDGIYISWKVFGEYAQWGSLILKKMVQYSLDRLLGEKKTITTNLPARGITTFTKQPEKKRYVVHLLYASPVKKGNMEVIEDIIPIHNTELSVQIKEPIKRVYLAPFGEELSFEQKDGAVHCRIPVFENHCMAVLEYS